MSDLLQGLALPLRAVAFVGRDGPLLLLALAPALLSLAVMGAVLVFGSLSGDRLLAAFWARPGACAGCSALPSFGAGLARIAWGLAWGGLVLVLAALAGLLVSRVVTAPLMDALAGRVVRRLGLAPAPGVTPQAARPFAASPLGAITEGLARTAVLLAGAVALWLPALVPGGALLSAPLGLAWTAAWVFADTMQYALQWTGPGRVRDSLALARRRPGLALGFTLSVSLGSLMPLAGALVTPLAVVGACLLLAEVEGRPDAPVHPRRPQVPGIPSLSRR
jgi:uncharacterized protein involved in cysteine biosynthesis